MIGPGNLALNGEHIGQIAIVGLRPKMRVIARIDQLRIHPNLVAQRCTLPQFREKLPLFISKMRGIPAPE